METTERTLIESVKHARGRYGGFPFGDKPDGVSVHAPLPAGTVFPNGARAALLLTFDVEGTYGNGTGEMAREIANYEPICERLARHGIPATFNVVGKMAEDHGPQFVRWMLDAGCEVASHGYIHELNQRYGGHYVYAGHYGPVENTAQVEESIQALRAIDPRCVRGMRLPYAHFNEFTYDAIEAAGLAWTSNTAADDFLNPANAFGPAPFQIALGEKRYPLVEIPFDSQTYDWSIWIADEAANGPFVESVRRYCASRSIAFERTPECGVAIWRRRMLDAVERQGVFTFLSHPINLVVPGPRRSDPLHEFMLPVIDELGRLHREGKAWVCTCDQMAEQYWAWRKGRD